MNFDKSVVSDSHALQICTHFISCRLHTIFVLLNLAVLGWFLYSAPRASWLLRSLIGGATAFAVGFHALLGNVCFASTLAAVIHAQFSSFQVAGIRMVYCLAESLLASAVAADLVLLQSEGAGRTSKLRFLGVVALIGTVALGWWGTSVTDQTSVSRSSLPLLVARVSMAILLAASTVFIYSITKSRAILLLFFAIPLMLAAFCALNAVFPFDVIESRLSHHSDLRDSQQASHWSVAARCFAWATYLPTIRAVISHGIIISQLRGRVSPAAPLAAGIMLAKPRAPEWLLVSALVVLAAGAMQFFGMHPSSSFFPPLLHMRDLLDIELTI